MDSGFEWASDWTKAEPISLRIGEICAAIPLNGAWIPNDRIALAVASFQLAPEYHGSIHLLFGLDRRSSGNALARPLTEVALRTVWICAPTTTDQQIRGIMKGREFPILGEMQNDLSGKSLLGGRGEGVLHSLTHGGSTAMAAHYLQGEKRERANAAIIAVAAFCLSLAGQTVAQRVDQPEFVKQLAEATPMME